MSHRPVTIALLAVTVAVSGGAAAAALAGPPAAPTLVPMASSAKANPVVGTVTKLGGSKKLKVQAEGKGKAKTLTAGGELRLGDRVTLGKGVTATLKLTRPKSVTEGTVLVYVTSAKGTSHRSKLTKKGRTTTAVITPVKSSKK
ncbi:MAG: hypothetical protein QM679_00105 [Patulibacter sp.]